MTRWRSAVSGGIAAAVFGTAALAWATDGFAALTTDDARAATVRRAPVAVPAAMLADAPDAPVPLLPPGRVAIVDFVSTGCVTMCRAQGSAFQWLQRAVASHPDGARIALRTASFDPDDDHARLAGWREAFGADPARWTVGRLAAADQDRVLTTFGIVPVRDPVGGWRHNAALHVVDAGGRLVRIVPVTRPDVALAAALALVHDDGERRQP